MPANALCRCPHHGTWGHSESTEPRTATEFEAKFCQLNKDGRHKGRKRKICTSYRSRIQLETKCDKLQVRFNLGFFGIICMISYVSFVARLTALLLKYPKIMYFRPHYSYLFSFIIFHCKEIIFFFMPLFIPEYFPIFCCSKPENSF